MLYSGRDSQSRGPAQGQTAFIRGFSTYDGEDQVYWGISMSIFLNSFILSLGEIQFVNTIIYRLGALWKSTSAIVVKSPESLSRKIKMAVLKGSSLTLQS